MFRIKRKLREIHEEGGRLIFGLIGCGKMGKGLVSQLSHIDGMRASVIVDHTPAKGKNALIESGVHASQILTTDNLQKAERQLERGGFVVSDNPELLYKLPQIQGVVEATGNAPTGAEIAWKTMENKKHIIMLNVECDSVVGPILYKKAQEEGVVYTGSKGDEPGAIIDLVDFAWGAGFEVVAVGKGKNNPLNIHATQDLLREEALSKGLSPRMLTSFVDGTNTMTELTAVANAIGFVPDVIGGHGITTNPKEIAKKFCLKEQGGILNQYGIVDYAFGMAPGVFCIVTSQQKEVIDLMKYLGLGEGPNYLLYRPYHLTSLETPITIFDALVEKESSLAPIEGQCSDAVAIAKKDCQKGESVNGIGSDQVYGTIVSHRYQKKNNLLPIGQVTPEMRFTTDVKEGEMITYDMVEMDEDRLINKLRKKQDEMGL